MSAIYFKGDAAVTGDTPWNGDNSATAYYLPGTTNWADISINTGILVAPWVPLLLVVTYLWLR